MPSSQLGAPAQDPTSLSAGQSRALSQYQQFSEGQALATALGNTADAASLASRIAALKKQNPNLDYGQFQTPDFSNWQGLSPDKTMNALSGLARNKQLSYGKGGRQVSQAVENYKVMLNKAIEAKMKAGLQSEIDPTLQQAQAGATELMNKDAISATAEAEMRSRLTSQVRQAESVRLARIGAALGIGNVTNSPAGAALAQQAATEADQAVIGGTRDLGLQIMQMNQDAKRQNIDFASRIAQARMAVLGGDSKSLIGMQGDIASIIDALYSRNVSMDNAARAADAMGRTTFGDRLGKWTQLATGGANLILGGYMGGQKAGLWGGGGPASGAAAPSQSSALSMLPVLGGVLA